MTNEILTVLIIVFAASSVRAVFGFADALVAMPLLAVVLGLRTATPLVALMSLTNALIILVFHWRSLNRHVAGRLVLATLAGIPAGLFLLKGVDEMFMKSLLAVILTGFSLFKLFQPRLLSLRNDRWAYLFGVIAGVLGGAYNTNGPPVVMYAALRKWPPESFRATLQGYFFITGFFIVAGHGLGGLWTETVVSLYVYCLPVLAAAYLGGSFIHRRIPAEKFGAAVYVLLLVLGIYLFSQVW